MCVGARSTGPRQSMMSVGVGPRVTRSDLGSRPVRPRPPRSRRVNGEASDRPKAPFPSPLVHPATIVSSRAPPRSVANHQRRGRRESAAVSTDPRGTILRASVPASSLRRRSTSVPTQATSSELPDSTEVEPESRDARAAEWRLATSPVGGARFPCRSPAGARDRPVGHAPTPFVVVPRPPEAGSFLGVHAATETFPRSRKSGFQPGAFHHLTLRAGALRAPSPACRRATRLAPKRLFDLRTEDP